MARNYKHDVLLNKLNTSINTLETNPNSTQEDINKVVEYYNKVTRMRNYSVEEIGELEDRLKVYAPDLSIGGNSEEEIQNLTDVSPRSFKINKDLLKGALIGGAIVIVLGTAGCTLRSCAKPVETIETEMDVEPTPVPTPQPTATPKVLAENLAFDPNNNIEIVTRMSDFIADALTKGIPVKDVMTEEELRIADENEQSLVTIEQLMDFYMVMNIEDIDPIDYARLGYTTKTAETITDNYMYVARVFMTDALTANEESKLYYNDIIADKDSRDAVQEFVNYLAEYNSSNNKKELGKEIKEYIISNYINRDANIYSMSINEFTYRMMFVADMISNNSILPTDVNVILNEDGKISCDLEKEDGVKNKTERAEEFTSIYNTVDEKLEISREFINQDLTSISDDEKKSGAELEKEIKEAVLIKNVSYKLNPKFTMAESSKNVAAKKTTKEEAKNNYQTFTDKQTGKQVNVSNEEMAKYGAKNQAEYEAAKKAEFEEKAQNDSNHTIKDTDGNVVVSGSSVDTVQYEEGYKKGYIDGNAYSSKDPKSSNESYVAGYKEGYEKGYADRVALDESLKNQQQTTYYEDVQDKVVDENTTYEYESYTPVEPTPVPEQSTEITEDYIPEQTETFEEFVPIETETFEEYVPVETETIEDYVPAETENITETVNETIEEFTYTSSINNLKSLREELLNMSNIYTDEVSKIKC